MLTVSLDFPPISASSASFPGDPVFLFHYGAAAARLGDISGAAAIFRRLADADEGQSESLHGGALQWANWGALFHRLGELRLAEDAYLFALQRRRDDAAEENLKRLYRKMRGEVYAT